MQLRETAADVTSDGPSTANQFPALHDRDLCQMFQTNWVLVQGQ